MADAAPEASVPDASADAGDAARNADAGCRTAQEDALERFHSWCAANEDECKRPDEDVGAGQPTDDLDGDGIRELSWGWGPMPVNVETHLYSGKPGCAVHLATLPGNSSVHALPTRHDGHADLRAEDTSGCEGACKCTPDVSFFVFAQGEYHDDPKRHVQGTFTPCVPAP